MATPNRTWTIDPNRVFTDQDDQPSQFREIMLELKTIMVAANWVVQASSNGVIATDDPTPASNPVDNWNTVADINIDESPDLGHGSGSWIVLRSPVGWLPGGAQVDLLLQVDATDLVNPQHAPIQIAPLFYKLDGTVSTQLPTVLPGTQTAVGQGNEILIIPWSNVTDGRWCSWYTSAGDIMFGVKAEGQRGFRFFLILSANTGSGDTDGQGGYRFVYGTAAGGTDALVDVQTAFSWRSSEAGGVATSSVSLKYETTSLSQWTDGYDFKGETKILEAHHIIQLLDHGRSLGRLFGGDVAVAIRNTPFGTIVSSENGQELRRICISGLWVFYPDAARPIR